MWIICLTLLLMVERSFGIIYRLNASEFNRMPPIYRVDSYDRCLNQPDGIYCTVSLDVVSDAPSDLLTMMQEYSQHKRSHFNHTHLLYGVCVLDSCKQFVKDETVADSKQVLEECMNDTLWNEYKLKSKVVNKPLCRKTNDNINIDSGDVAVAVTCGLIIAMSIIGSIYDFFSTLKNCKKGNRFLLCFSLKRNWNLLTNKDVKESDRLDYLRCFDGLRVITCMLAIISHAFLIIVVLADRMQYIESMYDNIYWHLFYEGPLSVQTFFLISGCSLAYYLSVLEEKNAVSWRTIPKEILMKWLGLSPVYSLMLSLTSTWQRHAGSGPFWEIFVAAEVTDCRRDGWLNILYFNNYIDHSQCMPQTWYLAADMQLTAVGLCVLVLTRGRARTAVLGLLLVAGIAMPSLHTYYQDLDATQLVAPETARNFFVEDPTFNNVYKRGHTNLATYVLGILFGLLIFHWQKTPPNVQQSKKYRILYYSAYPGALAVILYRSLLFVGGPPAPIYTRVLYLGFAKPVFASIIMIISTGLAFQFKCGARSVLEWRGWAAAARVSFCADIVHVFFIRNIGGSGALLKNASVMHFLETSLGILTIAYLVAFPYWIFVEAPATELIKIFTSSSPSSVSPEHEEKPVNDASKTDVDVDLNGVISVKL